MEPESRAHTALRNSFWSIAGSLTPILVAAFVTPIIIFGLGEHDYGVYAFLVSIVSIMGVIDLGVSTAISRYITEYHSRDEDENLSQLMKTANSVALLVGIIGLIAALTLGAGGHALISGALAPHVAMFYVIIGLIFFVNSVSMVHTVALNALQRFDISAKTGTTLLILASLLNIAVIKLGYGITGLLAVQLALSVATTAVSRIYARKLLPHTPLFSIGWSREEARRLYSFGTKSFAANIGGLSSTYLSRLIIPLFLGPTALTYYSVPGNVASKIPSITGTLSAVLFPLTASLHSVGETERVKRVYTRSFRLIAILSAAAASSVIFFAEPILRYWLNDTFAARSANILILLTLANFGLALYGPLYQFLLGLGRLKMITVVSFAMGIVNAVFLFALLPFLDISGAAWAYLLSMLPVAYVMYHTERKYLGIEMSTHYYAKLAAKIGVTALASFVAARYLWLPLTKSFPALMLTGPLSVVTYLILYKLFGFYEIEDSRDLANFGRRILKRI